MRSASREVITSPPFFFWSLWQEKQFDFSTRIASAVSAGVSAARAGSVIEIISAMSRMSDAERLTGKWGAGFTSLVEPKVRRTLAVTTGAC